MPNFIQPNRSALYTNVPLTEVSVAFFQDVNNFVADRVFPTVPVSKSTNIFYTFDKDALNRNEIKQRGRGVDPAVWNRLVSQDTYNAKLYALGEVISVEDEADSDDAFNFDVDAAEALTRQILINREISWANTYFKSGVWATDVDGVNAAPGVGELLHWSDEASTPFEDIEAAKISMGKRTSYEPNTLTIGREVFAALKNHPDIVDRIKYGQTSGGPALVTEQTLASALELDRVLIARAIQNTAPEGNAPSSDYILGKNALLTYAPDNPGLRTASAGYTFAWNVYSRAGFRIRPMGNMDPAVGRGWVVDDAFDQKLVSNELGYFFNGIVA